MRAKVKPLKCEMLWLGQSCHMSGPIGFRFKEWDNNSLTTCRKVFAGNLLIWSNNLENYQTLETK